MPERPEPKEEKAIELGELGSKVRFYPVEHSKESRIPDRKWEGLEEQVNKIKNSHALAIEGSRTEEEREKIRKALRERRKYYLKKDSKPIVEKCREEGINLIFIDAQRKPEELISQYRKTAHHDYIQHLRKGETAKLESAEWKKTLKSADTFRSLVMASNLEQAVKLYEKRTEKPADIAVLATSAHTKEIKKFLSNPQFKELKRRVRRITKEKQAQDKPGTSKHGIAEWKGLLVLKPENLAVKGEENA